MARHAGTLLQLGALVAAGAWLSACEVRPPEPLPAGTAGPVLTVAALAAPVVSLTSSLDKGRVLLEWTTTGGATTTMESRNRGRHFRAAAAQVPRFEAAGAWTVVETADPLFVRATNPVASRTPLTLPRPTVDAIVAWSGVDDDGLLLVVWRTAGQRHLVMTRHAMNPLETHTGMGFAAPITVTVDAAPGAPATAVPLHGGVVVAWVLADGSASRVVTREFAFEALCAPTVSGVERPPLVGAPGLPVLPSIVLH